MGKERSWQYHSARVITPKKITTTYTSMLKVHVFINRVLRSYHSNALRTTLKVCIVPTRSLVLEDRVMWDLLNDNTYTRFARMDLLSYQPHKYSSLSYCSALSVEGQDSILKRDILSVLSEKLHSLQSNE